MIEVYDDKELENLQVSLDFIEVRRSYVRSLAEKVNQELGKSPGYEGGSVLFNISPNMINLLLFFRVSFQREDVLMLSYGQTEPVTMLVGVEFILSYPVTEINNNTDLVVDSILRELEFKQGLREE